MVWQLLEREGRGRTHRKLQAMWRAIARPQANQPEIARAGCVEMRDFVRKIRRHTEKLFDTPHGARIRTPNSSPS